jgi:hypothetical protein
MLFDSIGRTISSMTFSLKSDGNEHPCAWAILRSSSNISETKGLTATFSSNAVCDGVSNITLKGWKAIGLKKDY